jgi:hypothetical protein
MRLYSFFCIALCTIVLPAGAVQLLARRPDKPVPPAILERMVRSGRLRIAIHSRMEASRLLLTSVVVCK